METSQTVTQTVREGGRRQGGRRRAVSKRGSTEVGARVMVVAGPGVPIEKEAVAQLDRVAGLPGCRAAVGMPDLHTGPGIPVGACFAFDRIWPGLLGSDVGCGAAVTIVKAKRHGDALERRVRAEMTRTVSALRGANRDAAIAAMAQGARGLAAVPALPEALREMARAVADPVALPPGMATDESWIEIAAAALGTIGGGNHFAEISRIAEVRDGAAVRQFGFDHRARAVVVHSGSRGIGAAVSRKWANTPLSIEEGRRYLNDHALALRFAQANRLVLSYRLMTALGVTRLAQRLFAFDVCHNGVVEIELDGHRCYLHRKGAAPADHDSPTVVLGSRGAWSWIMNGGGNAATLFSVAHGAGRRVSRADAAKRFRLGTTRRSLTRTRLGGRVICDDSRLLYEEHPDAYKPIENVVCAIEASGMAQRVAALGPEITVKQ